MADSDDFLAVARVIEHSTSLSEMQSRGLVRRLIKQAGLDPQDVMAHQLVAVAKTLLNEALRKNGVADTEPIIRQWLDCCAKQVDAVRTSARMHVSNTVEEVFTRMGLKR